MAMKFDQARINMVKNQIRPWEVLDPDVLNVLEHVHREEFVPDAYRQLAFADLCLPLGHDQVMMKPVVEGRVLQALTLQPDERVLEIGTGSGFFTACLASLTRSVTSVDIYEDFTAHAAQRLDTIGRDNVELATGEAICHWQPHDQFDAIVVTGAVNEIPGRLLQWLKPGGRLLAICGISPAQQVVRIMRDAGGYDHTESLFETDMPYLVHAEPKPAFVF